MKTFRPFCIALVLIAAFAMPALATTGDIHTPGASGDVLTPGAAGDVLTPGASGDVSTPGALNSPGITTPGYSELDLQSRAWGALLWLIPELAF